MVNLKVGGRYIVICVCLLNSIGFIYNIFSYYSDKTFNYSNLIALLTGIFMLYRLYSGENWCRWILVIISILIFVQQSFLLVNINILNFENILSSINIIDLIFYIIISLINIICLTMISSVSEYFEECKSRYL